MMLLIEKNNSLPIYRQLYQQFRDQILSGVLETGARLPPVRTLALQLGISKNSVTQAYAQLYSEGYVYSRMGSGYYVTKLELTHVPARKRTKHPICDVPADTRVRLEYSTIHPSDFPFQKWKKCVDETLLYDRERILLRYSERDGILPLRTELASYLQSSRGVVCVPEQVFVASSTQELLERLAKIFLWKRNIRQFAVEEPGFDLARKVFAYEGYSILTIPVTSIGLDCSCLRTDAPQILYITPSHQFPTGAILPIQQRQQLLRWAVQTGSYVLEDDYDSELRYHSMPIPSLQGIDIHQTVIYLGTTSKAFAPGLRLSYAVLPEHLIIDYEELFEGYNNTVPDLLQYAFYHFMERGDWALHLRRVCSADQKRHDLFVHLLKKMLPDGFSVLGDGGGVHLLIQSDDMTEAEMIDQAAAVGIQVFPVSRYWMEPKHYGNNQVLVGYAMLRTEEIPELVSRLGKAWRRK